MIDKSAMKIVQAKRRSSVLTPSSLACLVNTPTINVTSGCAHNCLYCYARGYSTYPGEGTVVIYENILDQLQVELAHRRARPVCVYFSPSTDVFQPITEAQDLCYSVFEFLLGRGIGVAFLTKGIIPEKTMYLLLNHPDMVRAQIGIITPDDLIRKTFEPYAADIDVRFRQMEMMNAHGIAVEARVMPVLPGITDAIESMERLFRMIARTGVTRAAVSALFLRPAIAAALRKLAPNNYAVANMLNLYRYEKRLSVHAEHSSVVPLPKRKREEMYAKIKQAAEFHKIEISICGCMNPDFGGICNIGGQWRPKCKQADLFE
jgi:DNA repair photolyase